jgi:hypothetical protein
MGYTEELRQAEKLLIDKVTECGVPFVALCGHHIEVGDGIMGKRIPIETLVIGGNADLFA